MGRAPQAWLVVYDVTDDKRRTKIYKTLRGYGDHIQFSVFRCIVSDLQIAELRERLEGLVNHKEDQVLLVPLGSPDATRFKQWIAVGKSLEAAERTVVSL